MTIRIRLITWAVLLLFFIANAGNTVEKKKQNPVTKTKRSSVVSKKTPASAKKKQSVVNKTPVTNLKKRSAVDTSRIEVAENPLASFDPTNPQREFTYKHDNIRYWIFLPSQYGQSQKEWPLVMYLHGASERGKSIDSLKQNVMYNFLQPTQQVAELKDLPFIVVAPLCPVKQLWIPSQLRGVLDDVLANCTVDKKRLYLTGHSMGAFGTWSFASTYPNLFAAIVPVSGGGQVNYVKSLVDIPTWAFHGELDTVVPARRSTVLVSVLNMVGGDAKLTLLPNQGHTICRETYSNPDLWQWMLAQEKNSDSIASSAGQDEK